MASTPPGAGIELASEWPAVRHQLLQALAARGVSPTDAEDLVQEVAARALVHEAGFATAEDLGRWGWRVAWRLRIDAVRKDGRLDHGACPDVAGPDDSARIVEGRVALEATLAGFTRLSEADRIALFAAPDPDASRQEAVKLAVRRHRARARLLRLAGGAAGLGSWVNGVFRRVRPQAKLAAAATLPLALIVVLELAPAIRPPDAGARIDPTPSPARAGGPAATESRATVADPGGTGGPAADRAGQAPSPAARTVATVPVGDSGQLRIEEEELPDHPLFCARNIGPVPELCVDRPGPTLEPPPPLD